MRWDRKIAVFAVIAAVLLCGVLGYVIYETGGAITDSDERIEERAREGFYRLRERLEHGSVRVLINRRGKYENQERYSGYSDGLLDGMEMTDAAFLSGEMEYTHTVKLTLIKYADEWNEEKSPEVTFYKNGSSYYVIYVENGEEYRFRAQIPALTEWIDGLSRTGE